MFTKKRKSEGREGPVSSGRRKKTVGPFGGPTQSQKVVSATLYNCTQQWGNISTGVTAIPTFPAYLQYSFHVMVAPRTAVGTGVNTSNALGVWQMASSNQASILDPYHRNFLGFKLDHSGFNSVNVEKYNEAATTFQYVKMSKQVLQITLPEAPVVKGMPTTQTRPGIMTDAQYLALQQTMMVPGGSTVPAVLTDSVWPETRPVGMWQYIKIPAQDGSSVNLFNNCSMAGWQRLLDNGYRPKICKGRNYFLRCEAKGCDMEEMENIRSKHNQLATGLGIPNFNPWQPGQTYNGTTKHKHQKQETDWSCQYFVQQPDTEVGAQAQLVGFNRQGFDCVAFGEAIIFMFVMFAPPTLTTGINTAPLVTMPYSMIVHSKATFTGLRSNFSDTGQLSTQPQAFGL